MRPGSRASKAPRAERKARLRQKKEALEQKSGDAADPKKAAIEAAMRRVARKRRRKPRTRDPRQRIVMQFATGSSPHLAGPQSVTRVMALVLLALVPGTWRCCGTSAGAF